MKSKFDMLAESILNGTDSTSPGGRECLKKFISYLFKEYGVMDDLLTKKQAVELMKKYDQDPKSVGTEITDLLDGLGFNDMGINDNEDIFGDDQSHDYDAESDTKITFNQAMEWAKCLDTIATSTGVDMNRLGLKSYVDYVEGCERQAEES